MDNFPKVRLGMHPEAFIIHLSNHLLPYNASAAT